MTKDQVLIWAAILIFFLCWLGATLAKEGYL